MSKRLEVTLFGTVFTVSALYLSRPAVKAAVKTYGPTKWNGIVRDIALGTDAKRRMAEVSHTLGHPVRQLYRSRGLAMHDNRFGIEVFFGGEHVPTTMVAAQNRTLQPQDLMEDCKLKDMVGVFWARREGAVTYRWDAVDFSDQGEVALVYDGLAPLLGRKQAFDLVLDVTWQGRRADKRRELGADQPFAPLEHVFHIVG